MSDVQQNLLPWIDVATSAAYRNQNPSDQYQTQQDWLAQVGPSFYGADLNRNFAKQSAVQDYMDSVRLPPKAPDEDTMIRPDTMSMTGISTLEANPAFARKSLEEQQQLKQTWFARMAATDPEYKQLAPEQQASFYNGIMSKAPSFINPKMLNYKAGLDFWSLEQEAKEFTDLQNADKAAQAYVSDIKGNLIEGATSLVAGPARFVTETLLGKNNPLTDMFLDIEKMHTWQKAVSGADNPIPGFVANIVGMVGSGMVGGLTKGLAGDWATTQGVIKTTKAGKEILGKVPIISAAGQLIPEPGLLESIGSLTKLGKKIPSAIYQMSGGATAAGLIGVAQNMYEGEDPLKNLPTNLLLGIGFEGVSRFIGSKVLLGRYLKSINYKGTVNDFFNKPLSVTPGQALDDEFAQTFFASPIGKQLKQMQELTKNGFPLKDYFSPDSVNLRAEMIGMKIVEDADALKIMKGSELIQTIKADNAEVRWNNASQILDTQDDAWNKVFNKTFPEQVQQVAGVKAIVGVPYTAKSREIILNEIRTKSLGVLGADFQLDPAMDDSKIADIFKTIVSHDSKKAASLLTSKGVNLRVDVAPGDDANAYITKKESVVANIKAQLEQTMPQNEFFFVKGSKILEPKDVPQVIFEDPNSLNVSATMGVYTGPMSDIRRALVDLRQVNISAITKETKIFKNNRLSISRHPNNRVVELNVDIPNSDGVFHPVTLHFNSEQKALNFMRGNNKEEFLKVFQNDAESFESFRQFTDGLRGTNRKQYNSDYLPFAYLTEEARQKQMFLGVYKGKYILEDKLNGPSSTKSEIFDNLYDVSKALKEKDIGQQLPDLVGISQDAIEKIHPEGIDHPFIQPVPPQPPLKLHEIKKLRYNVLKRMGVYYKPTTAMMDQFNALPMAQDLREAGMDPTAMFNAFTRSSMAKNHWFQRELVQAKSHMTLPKQEDELAYRYLEAPWKKPISATPGYDPMTKVDVETEMLEKLGHERTEVLKGIATQVRQKLEGFFSANGLDGPTYLDDYMPRVYAALRKNGRNTSGRMNLEDAISWLPSTKQKEFFEHFREVDLNSVAYERSLSTAYQAYLRATARKLFITPTLDIVKDVINKVNKNVWKDSKPADAVAFIDYIRNIMRNMQGAHTAAEVATDVAEKETLSQIYNSFPKLIRQFTPDGNPKRLIDKLGLTFDPNVRPGKGADKLTALSTIAYIGGRPWSAVKQVLSAFTISGPVLGIPRIMEGVNLISNPGNWQRVFRAGVLQSTEDFVTGGIGLGKTMKKITDIAMKLFMIADNFQRGVAYLGMEASLKRELAIFHATGGTQAAYERLRTSSGMNLFGLAQEDYGMKMLLANPGPAGDAAFVDHFSKLAVDETAYMYERFQRPQMLRSVLGRTLGQFGIWPLNFISMLKRTLTRDSLSLPQKIATFAQIGLVGTAVAKGFQAAGINDKSLYPYNQISFQGGPYYSMMNDLLQAIGGSQSAYTSFSKAVTGLIPFSRAGGTLIRSIDYFQQGDFYKGFLSLASAPVILEPGQSANPGLVPDVTQALIDGGKAFYGLKKEIETP